MSLKKPEILKTVKLARCSLLPYELNKQTPKLVKSFNGLFKRSQRAKVS